MMMLLVVVVVVVVAALASSSHLLFFFCCIVVYYVIGLFSKFKLGLLISYFCLMLANLPELIAKFSFIGDMPT